MNLRDPENRLGLRNAALTIIPILVVTAAVSILIFLTSCTFPDPAASATASAPIDTKPLGDHLTAAQVANLSAGEQIARLRKLQREDAKLIRLIP